MVGDDDNSSGRPGPPVSVANPPPKNDEIDFALAPPLPPLLVLHTSPPRLPITIILQETNLQPDRYRTTSTIPSKVPTMRFSILLLAFAHFLHISLAAPAMNATSEESAISTIPESSLAVHEALNLVAERPKKHRPEIQLAICRYQWYIFFQMYIIQVSIRSRNSIAEQARGRKKEIEEGKKIERKEEMALTTVQIPDKWWKERYNNKANIACAAFKWALERAGLRGFRLKECWEIPPGDNHPSGKAVGLGYPTRPPYRHIVL